LSRSKFCFVSHSKKRRKKGRKGGGKKKTRCSSPDTCLPTSNNKRRKQGLREKGKPLNIPDLLVQDPGRGKRGRGVKKGRKGVRSFGIFHP